MIKLQSILPESRKMARKENIEVNLGQPRHEAYIFAVWYGRSIWIVNWQLSKQGIRWPVSHDRIEGSSVELIEVTCVFIVYRSPGYGFSLDRRLKYFGKLLEQAKNLKLRC